MKTNLSDCPLLPRKGMTLIELTVVIMVLLGLITVVFVGGKAWKRGSDRSMALIMIRNAQMGLRAYCQIEDVTTPTYPNLPEALFGQDRFVSNGIDRETGLAKPAGTLPNHPVSGLSFDYVAGDGDVVPPLGTLYICTGGSSGVNDFTYNPQPSIYRQW